MAGIFSRLNPGYVPDYPSRLKEAAAAALDTRVEVRRNAVPEVYGSSGGGTEGWSNPVRSGASGCHLATLEWIAERGRTERGVLPSRPPGEMLPRASRDRRRLRVGQAEVNSPGGYNEPAANEETTALTFAIKASSAPASRRRWSPAF
jgi:hypothetical protein